jgi:two-component system, OmpR family, KDP operon response regulator KdpE
MISAHRARRLAVLLIDSDTESARETSQKLDSHGYDVWHVESAADARSALNEQHPDVILMEIVLRDADGLLLCAALREIAEVPIFVCSRTSRKRDAALSLKLGADEFLRKPLDIDEFDARLERVLGNAYQYPTTPTTSETLVRVGELSIDRAGHQATVGGRPLALTPTEFRLLDALASQPGTLVSHARLAELLWSDADPNGSSMQAINVHMHRLRGKLGRGSGLAPTIVSVRGVGYKLVAGSSAGALVIFPSSGTKAS